MQVANRRRVPPHMHGLYIIKRQMTPRCRLWMFALIEPGDSSGTFIYSDFGNTVEPSKDNRTHPNFDRLQFVDDLERTVISMDPITHIPQSKMYGLRGFYESISLKELDLLPNTDWMLVALYVLERNSIVPDHTWHQWSARFTSEQCATLGPSYDTMRAHGAEQSSSPPRHASFRGPSAYEAHLAGVHPDINTTYLDFGIDKPNQFVRGVPGHARPGLPQQPPGQRSRSPRKRLSPGAGVGIGAGSASTSSSMRAEDSFVQGETRQISAVSLRESPRPSRRRRH